MMKEWRRESEWGWWTAWTDLYGYGWIRSKTPFFESTESRRSIYRSDRIIIMISVRIQAAASWRSSMFGLDSLTFYSHSRSTVETREPLEMDQSIYPKGERERRAGRESEGTGSTTWSFGLHSNPSRVLSTWALFELLEVNSKRTIQKYRKASSCHRICKRRIRE